MKLFAALLVLFGSSSAFAFEIACRGQSTSYDVSLSVRERADNASFSDITVELSDPEGEYGNSVYRMRGPSMRNGRGSWVLMESNQERMRVAVQGTLARVQFTRDDGVVEDADLRCRRL